MLRRCEHNGAANRLSWVGFYLPHTTWASPGSHGCGFKRSTSYFVPWWNLRYRYLFCAFLLTNSPTGIIIVGLFTRIAGHISFQNHTFLVALWHSVVLWWHLIYRQRSWRWTLRLRDTENSGQHRGSLPSCAAPSQWVFKKMVVYWASLAAAAHITLPFESCSCEN